jgi:hypothetical protein
MVNRASVTCEECGRTVDPEAGYHFFGPDGPRTLCADCYQRRVQEDAGDVNQDLGADVDQSLPGDPQGESAADWERGHAR